MQDNASGADPVQTAAEAGSWKRERRIDPKRTGLPGGLGVELIGAVVSIAKDQPVVLLASSNWDGNRDGLGAALRLPAGQFEPSRHDTLEAALRDDVLAEGAQNLGHLEQLSAECRTAGLGPRAGQRSLSIGYLALTRVDVLPKSARSRWFNVYDALPWEDWRKGQPACLTETIVPALLRWAGNGDTAGVATPTGALARVRIAFGLGDCAWDDERVVERLDVLRDAGLAIASPMGELDAEHGRILAAALGRLRAKVRFRPVIFELLSPEFTLFELQRTVEAILGPHLHKQNFRRLVEGMGLVEPTGDVRSNTGGRPAKLFRFRPEVMLERAAPGVRIRAGKAA